MPGGRERHALVVELVGDQVPALVHVRHDRVVADAHVVVEGVGTCPRSPCVGIFEYENPGSDVGTRKMVMPACFGASGSVRAASQM